jgi:hypothetical protein
MPQGHFRFCCTQIGDILRCPYHLPAVRLFSRCSYVAYGAEYFLMVYCDRWRSVWHIYFVMNFRVLQMLQQILLDGGLKSCNIYVLYVFADRENKCISREGVTSVECMPAPASLSIGKAGLPRHAAHGSFIRSVLGVEQWRKIEEGMRTGSHVIPVRGRDRATSDTTPDTPRHDTRPRTHEQPLPGSSGIPGVGAADCRVARLS